ncbi:MAG: hypothetical protein AB8B36_11585, partial [Prochlorococcus sp.]
TITTSAAELDEGETLPFKVSTSTDDRPDQLQHIEAIGGTSTEESYQLDFSALPEFSEALDLQAESGIGTIGEAAVGSLELSIKGVYVNSASGDDEITGTAFADFIRGGAGDDRIHTGAGDDLIRGGAGRDVIITGSGLDVVYWTPDQLDGSKDVIKDFSVDDRLAVHESISVSLLSANELGFSYEVAGEKRSGSVLLEGVSSFEISDVIMG